MFISKTLSFYKRDDVQEAIVEHAEDKEVAVKYGEQGFGQRPQVLSYPNDVLELAKQRATSFHCSEELWTNPSALRADMQRDERDELRKGWDLLIDLDCPYFQYSKITAHYVVKAMRYCGVESVSVKFSGNKGFHIAIPWEAFPDTVGEEDASDMFPEAPRRIAEYLKFLIREPVKQQIIEREGGDLDAISDKVDVAPEELKVARTDADGAKTMDLNVDPFIEMDTLLITSRHLYRMPYSFHETSELVSIPVNPSHILEFEKRFAEPENIDTITDFCPRDIADGDAHDLFVRAFDHKPEIEDDEETERKEHLDLPEEAIGTDCFPPCMQKILSGLDDGRKRAVFILINFLRSCGWTMEQVEDLLYEWNENNPESLREVYIQGQLNYAKNKDPVPPPNCHHDGYYVDMGVKCDEEVCDRFKNPINYAKACHERDSDESDS